MIPRDFHRMTDLRCDDAIINLEGKSVTRLVIGRRYFTNMISYFDIEADYRPLPYETAEDCTRMAKAFMLYILGAYHFANGG